MKDKLYYTPEIEEFHVGFEYRLKGEEVVRMLTTNCTVDTELSEVKYLDKEDIGSLGFVFKGGDTHLTYHYGGYAITHTPSNNKINIYYYDGSEFVNAITIKNKSELKKLLKMLGIL